MPLAVATNRAFKNVPAMLFAVGGEHWADRRQSALRRGDQKQQGSATELHSPIADKVSAGFGGSSAESVLLLLANVDTGARKVGKHKTDIKKGNITREGWASNF